MGLTTATLTQLAVIRLVVLRAPVMPDLLVMDLHVQVRNGLFVSDFCHVTALKS